MYSCILPFCLPPERLSALAPRGTNLKRFKDCCLKAKARIRP